MSRSRVLLGQLRALAAAHTKQDLCSISYHQSTYELSNGEVFLVKSLSYSRDRMKQTPWNGRGRRLVELTDGSHGYSGGDSQGLPGSLKVEKT